MKTPAIKTNLQQQYKNEYSAGAVPGLIRVSAAQYLSVSGKGDPDGPDFAARISCLYTMAYTLKFMCKLINQDFVVSKLEALWWYDEAVYGQPGMAAAPVSVPRQDWYYRLLIRLPDEVTAHQAGLARETVIYKKKMSCAAAIDLYRMDEGLVVQLMHTGPFDTEPQSLARIAAFTEAHGLKQNGLHHEIYLSDFRKTAPEKLRTILREPVTPL